MRALFMVAHFVLTAECPVLKFWCSNWLLFKLWCCFQLYSWASTSEICLCSRKHSLKHAENLESLLADYQIHYSAALYFKLMWSVRSLKNSETTTLNCHYSLVVCWTWTFSSDCGVLIPVSRSHFLRLSVFLMQGWQQLAQPAVMDHGTP